MGKLVGVRQATISRIESNAKNSSWGIIHKILLALLVDMNDIKGFTHDFVLKENDFELFIKLLIANSQLKTNILYNTVHCARIIIDAYNRGIINFDEKYGKNKV
ncbi:hypothetical protein [Spiroplasma endosymbiont of Notiophilus biguttatus]|uniref:hypothetical protein n=1 Tax=Spiroplasma endosymbiont of Notiophilus biguttatus TaxID=3066285 RepID=UPI00313CB6B7